ncbi:hypothetical protein [Actinoallomurus vinaceus]|uniref:hypothetical protein n=1 Tax=Actinoallomurus vinaceus TaxID=1080074 RepID=UPI0031E9F449
MSIPIRSWPADAPELSGQTAEDAVRVLYEAHARDLVRLAVVMVGDRQDRYIARFAVRAGGDTVTAVVTRSGSDDGPYTVERFFLSTGRRVGPTARISGRGSETVAFDATGDHLLLTVGKALLRIDDGQVRRLRKGHTTTDLVYLAW